MLPEFPHTKKSLKYFFAVGAMVVLSFFLLIITQGTKKQQDIRSRAQVTITLPQVLNYLYLRILGQPNYKETMVNRITPNRGMQLGGVHIDSKGRIYVLDSGNNRILGFSSYQLGKAADIVLGQPSLFDSGTVNGDNTEYLPPTASTLAILPYPWMPSTLESGRYGQMATDANDNLYFLDFNNNRVLKFISPFTTDSVADEVWGQPGFNTRQSHCGQTINGVRYDPSASTLCTEWGTEFTKTTNMGGTMGVAVDSMENLWVTDISNNRILRFPRSVRGETIKDADLVLGQTDFTSRNERGGFETRLDRMRAPKAIKFKKSTGELYVLDGDWAGQARIMVFAPPFTNGMSATREFARAQFQDSEPQDKTGWEMVEGKWVHETTGLSQPRGLTFSPDESRLWINDSGNQRVLQIDNYGVLINVIGQPDFMTNGCQGKVNQGYIAADGVKHNLCDPQGEIGIDQDGKIYIANVGSADARDIAIFPSTITRNPSGLAAASGYLLHWGTNEFSGKTMVNTYGMSIYTNPERQNEQLYVSDGQRLLVWNNPENVSNFQDADYIVGQDTPFTNYNHQGVFAGIHLSAQTIGGGYLWIQAEGRILAYKIPISKGGANYQPDKVLDNGKSLRWADDGTFVDFEPSGLFYRSIDNSLWISDWKNNRVLRVDDPVGNPTVNLVIGQPDKNSTCDNACLGATNAKGFAEPWSLSFDGQGNLYVVDSKFEGGQNNRVLRFDSASVTPVSGNIFPFPAATGVYGKSDFTSTKSLGDENPGHPTWVSHGSWPNDTTMVILTDGYGNKQKERVFVYIGGHESEVAPKPHFIVPIAFGQAATAYFYPYPNYLAIQDHTWNRILFVKVPDLPIIQPENTPLPSLFPTLTPTPFSDKFVKILYPNGGEIIKEGSLVKITWQSKGVENCLLSYLNQSGVKSNIAKITRMSSGRYNWKVKVGKLVNQPLKILLSCPIKGSSNIEDSSDGFFSVVTKPR